MRRLVLAGGVAVLLAVPAAANALGTATLSADAGTDGYGFWDYDNVHFVASGNTSDDITFSLDGKTLTAHDPGVLIAGVVDDGWTTFIGEGPVCIDGTTVRGCTPSPLVCASGVDQASCSLISPNTAAQPELGAMEADGGPGDDHIVIPDIGNSISNMALGGEGNDDLTAHLVDGGPGADKLNGVVLYTDETTGIAASDDGVANDGAPGEHDNITPGSWVQGTRFSDTITLRGAAWAYGESGDDVVSTQNGQAFGGDGADRVTVTGTGSAIGDDYSGPGGDDVIDVRNGFKNLVYCGPGDDTVIADAVDDTSSFQNCEHVTVG
jgi:hypothetical protein